MNIETISIRSTGDESQVVLEIEVEGKTIELCREHLLSPFSTAIHKSGVAKAVRLALATGTAERILADALAKTEQKREILMDAGEFASRSFMYGPDEYIQMRHKEFVFKLAEFAMEQMGLGTDGLYAEDFED